MNIENILSFDTATLKKHIEDHHSIYDFPVKDIAAENILANFFESNGCKIGWEPGSHKPGSDVFIYGNGTFGYSVKSGKEPMRGEWFKISSYRTGSDDAVEDKKKSIREIEKDIASYVIFARTEAKTRKEPEMIVMYSVYMIDPTVLAIDSFNIDPKPDENGNFNGDNKLGVKIVIAKKMSAQVWYSVPMAIVKEGNLIKRLCEVGPFSMKIRPCVTKAA